MRVNVTPEEAQLLQRTVDFANLKIRSTRQVESLFDLPIVGRPFKILRPGEEADYRENQATLRRWLERIAAGKGQEIAGEVAELLEIVAGIVQFDEQRLIVTYATVAYKAVGVRDCYALATAWLLEKPRGLSGRLMRCDCGRFRLDLKPRGRPTRYCSPAHRREAEKRNVVARVQKWRKAHPEQWKKTVVKSVGNPR